MKKIVVYCGKSIHSVWQEFNDADDTYLFACPRYKSRYNQLVLSRYKRLLPDYDGAVIENIRYPTPSSSIEALLSCFCPICRQEEPQSEEWRHKIRAMRQSMESASDKDLEQWGTIEGMFKAYGIDGLLRSRENAVFDLARIYEKATREAKKEFAMVLLSPGLSLLPGHDYPRLTALADWVRPLILCRARCPSGLRVEINSMLMGMVAWSDSFSIPAIMRFLSRTTGLDLPEDHYRIEQQGLPAELALGEVERAMKLSKCAVYPGFEWMRENPDYRTDTTMRDIQTYIKAAAKTPGFYMAWNLFFMPRDFFEVAGKYQRS